MARHRKKSGGVTNPASAASITNNDEESKAELGISDSKASKEETSKRKSIPIKKKTRGGDKSPVQVDSSDDEEEDRIYSPECWVIPTPKKAPLSAVEISKVGDVIHSLSQHSTPDKENQAGHNSETPIKLKSFDISLLDTLSVEAQQFIFGMVGLIKPLLSHLQGPLKIFDPLMPTTSFRAISGARCGEHGSLYRLQLRHYCNPTYPDTAESEVLREQSAFVEEVLVSFLHDHFGDSELPSLRENITRSRTLYITAYTDEPPDNECVISLLNYSTLGAHGFYINWLATSSELITKKKYGVKFSRIEAAPTGPTMTWQHRHLALFLLQLAKLATTCALQHEGLYDPSRYYVVLQASMKRGEIGHTFYTRHNFRAMVTPTPETMDSAVFQGFKQLLDVQREKDWTLDYIQWHDFSKDMKYMKTLLNISGNFDRRRSKNHQRSLVVSPEFKRVQPGENNAISVPFNIIREHLMVLSSGLEFFYLPFAENVDLKQCMQPSSRIDQNMITSISSKEREIIGTSKESAGKPRAGWFNDECINFVVRWYVKSKSVFVIMNSDEYLQIYFCIIFCEGCSWTVVLWLTHHAALQLVVMFGLCVATKMVIFATAGQQFNDGPAKASLKNHGYYCHLMWVTNTGLWSAY